MPGPLIDVAVMENGASDLGRVTSDVASAFFAEDTTAL